MRLYQWLQLGLVGMELLACLAGCFHWHKLRHSYWKWFVVYLGIIVLGEATALTALYVFKAGSLSNIIYVYIIIPLEFLFFYWLYFRYFAARTGKWWPLMGAGIYVASWAVQLLLKQPPVFWQQPLSYLVGIVVMMVLVIRFFVQFVSGEEILGYRQLGYRQHMMFWVSVGLLVFYLVSSPFWALRVELAVKYRHLFWIYYYVQFAVNYLMYLFFAIAFIWGKPR
jgi:hypothetical protein